MIYLTLLQKRHRIKKMVEVPLFSIEPRDFNRQPLTYAEKNLILEKCLLELCDTQLPKNIATYYVRIVEFLESELMQLN